MPPILGQPRALRSPGRQTRGRRSHSRVACYSVSRDRAIGSLKPLPWKRRNVSGCRAYSSAGLERTPDKREVGGSNPPRPTNSDRRRARGAVAQLVERQLCKLDVVGSTPISSTNLRRELES